MRNGRVSVRRNAAIVTLAALLLTGCADDTPPQGSASDGSTTDLGISPSGDVTPEPATVTVTATGGSTGTRTAGSAVTPTTATRTGGAKTGGAKTATGAPTGSVTGTLERVQLPGGPGYVNFESPSGNIQCVVGDDGAECLAFEAAWSVPDPGDCELDWGGEEVSVYADGSFAGSCRGDTFLIQSPPMLQYGQQYVQGDIRCVSREDGVSCEHLPPAGASG